MREYVLKEYYIRYLKEIRKLKESSVRHYLDAIRYISRFLVLNNKIKESLYEIHDVGELEILREYLKSNVEFMALDKRGHQMYSAGLNNYCKFASGEGFEKIDKKIEVLDIKVMPEESEKSFYQYWKRSSIVKMQTIKHADFKCEIDKNHKTFTAKSTGEQYMEAHHAIPMNKQDMFNNISLDVYANVICLCPICHRLIHYGIESERQYVLDKIYDERADRLIRCGIDVTKKEFKELIG